MLLLKELWTDRQIDERTVLLEKYNVPVKEKTSSLFTLFKFK